MKELPQYQCHKIVRAAKIERVFREGETISGGSTILPGNTIVQVGDNEYRDLAARHRPEVGGYYVKYEDGYTSYSPADAFESGYTLIP